MYIPTQPSQQTNSKSSTVLWLKLKQPSIGTHRKNLVVSFTGSMKRLSAKIDLFHFLKHSSFILQNHVHLELRLYDRLFKSKEPGSMENWLEDINKDSLQVIRSYGEASLANVKPEDKFQFERIGYFCCDLDSKKDKIVFNKTVSLKESKEKVWTNHVGRKKKERKKKGCQKCDIFLRKEKAFLFDIQFNCDFQFCTNFDAIFDQSIVKDLLLDSVLISPFAFFTTKFQDTFWLLKVVSK